MSIVKNQIVPKIPKVIDSTPNQASINTLPPRFQKEILSFLSPKETAATIHLVQSNWKNILFKDGCLDLTGSDISDDDLKQIIEVYQKKGEITSIKLAYGCWKITDKGLGYLTKLPLMQLDVSGCYYITDKGLEHLSHLPLTRLILSECEKITDKGLEHLSHLPLTRLNLSGCEKITDKGLEHLSHLPLTQLDLSHCFKIDKGLEHLSHLPLTRLNLSGCENITDKGLEHLSHLPLTQVKLTHCNKITDKGLEHLSHLPLTQLDVSGCDITDKGLEHLSHLSLTQLNLKRCNKITDKGLEHLSHLPLRQLDLTFCEGISTKGLIRLVHIPFTMADLVTIRFREEAFALQEFVIEKSNKLGINCFCEFGPTGHMSVNRAGRIRANSLFKLKEKDIDDFLLEKPDHKKSIATFLIEKRPELLDKVSSELIEWFRDYSSEWVAITEENILIAEEILIMHANGKLSTMKRFLLNHEMGHAIDYQGAKSLGDFDVRELDFIEPHQYGEVRADLTAAREENAHDVGIAFFECQRIIGPQPPEQDAHPTDENRVKALKMDKAKRAAGFTK